MLNILMYVLCYIGAAYVLMAVPCLLWHKYGKFSWEESSLPFIFFSTAPLTWPLATMGWSLEGWCWLREKAQDYWGRN